MATSRELLQIRTASTPTLYYHEPLKDPTTQMRLLSLNSWNSDGCLSLDLTTWMANAAPSYNAISYTWGWPDDNTTVLVNGITLMVRRNCLDALRQALAYDDTNHLWIDSICINQTDDNEKSHQVQRMWSVYKNARRVLVCLGRHDEHSEWLVKLHDLVQSMDNWPPPVDLIARKEFFGQLLERLDLPFDDFCKKTISAIHHFSTRPYWFRLWVIQEITAGGEAAHILCGTDEISWTYLSELAYALTGRDERSDTQLGQVVKFKSIDSCVRESGAIPLETLFELEIYAQCTDPRDQIYGLLSLIDWGPSGLKPLQVDYSRSPWSLAMQLALVKHLKIDSLNTLMRRFYIGYDTAEVQALVQKRIFPESSTIDSCQARDVHFPAVAITRLQRRTPRTLGITFDIAPREQKLFDSEDMTGILDLCERINSRTEHQQDALKLRRIYLNSQVVALGCSSTRPGDILVSMERCFYTGTSLIPLQCLILRPQSRGTRLDVVGICYTVGKFRGLMQQSASVQVNNPDQLPDDSVGWADLTLRLTAEDILLLLVRNADFDYNRSAIISWCVNRLIMRPLDVSQNAAGFTEA